MKLAEFFHVCIEFLRAVKTTLCHGLKGKILFFTIFSPGLFSSPPSSRSEFESCKFTPHRAPENIFVKKISASWFQKNEFRYNFSERNREYFLVRVRTSVPSRCFRRGRRSGFNLAPSTSSKTMGRRIQAPSLCKGSQGIFRIGQMLCEK